MRVLNVVITAGLLGRQSPAGIRLGELSWPEAERALTPDTVVVVPLAAAAQALAADLVLLAYTVPPPTWLKRPGWPGLSESKGPVEGPGN